MFSKKKLTLNECKLNKILLFHFINTSQQKIIIAVDGYASTGKSTLARQLADAINYIYIDTGAMYRAITLYFLQNKVDINTVKAVEDALQKIHINFINDDKSNKQLTQLNGEIVETELRTMEVSDFVSEVSAIKAVRKFLVAQQQKMGAEKGIVMDGRDIGTIVFPNAKLKLFINADVKERAKRRFYEMRELGINTTLEDVTRNLKSRDLIDTTRKHSPLKKANDAIEIDNTHLTVKEQLEKAIELFKEKVVL